MKNNQQNQKKGRGGYRPNSGRPKGSTNKIAPKTLLNDFYRQNGMTFSQFINKKINEADIRGDHELVKQYVLGLAKYIVQDTQDIKVDHTTLGQPIQTVFNFPQKELQDWNPEVTFKYESNNKD
jgi:hypothetical protein